MEMHIYMFQYPTSNKCIAANALVPSSGHTYFAFTLIVVLKDLTTSLPRASPTAESVAKSTIEPPRSEPELPCCDSVGEFP